MKGPKGELSIALHDTIGVTEEEGSLQVRPHSDAAWAMAGTFRALIANMVTGVTDGFEKARDCWRRVSSAGARRQIEPEPRISSVPYEMPEGVSVETPSQTEIVLKGSDKQRVGQAAAEIRAYRPPEPYKGKGIRYSGEYVARKTG